MSDPNDTEYLFPIADRNNSNRYISCNGIESIVKLTFFLRDSTMTQIIKKRLCVICGASRDDRDMRCSSKIDPQNAILVACLSACDGLRKVARTIYLKKTLDAKTIYNNCLFGKRHLCHRHYILAAKYIVSEMESVGKQIQPFTDPQATGSAAYVTKNDIPSHVVKFVNEFMIAEEISGKVTVKDVCHFMNIGLRRYYSTPLWPSENSEEGQDPYSDIDESPSSGQSRSPENFVVKAEAVTGTPSIKVEEHHPEVTSSSSGIGSYMDCEDRAEFYATEKPSSFKNEITSIINSIEEPKPVCVICGNQNAMERVRTSSPSKLHNAILFASLSAVGCCRLDAKAVYDSCNEGGKILCGRHYAVAAQFIAAQMDSFGKSLAKFKDRKNFQVKAYMTVYDIPSKVVKLVNDFMVAMKVGRCAL
ncbi:hypothetical protein TELCIR_02969 [Teladorsagia circumcincta]|uniref:Uncharacterized protein n=1 Tax=Teladorsagia circumcincta TaxID=45464 RepID=A0A2G9UXP4_TELCI|nr:hypothetical protein TELCIR_02969 [Teladorsagia circumcincta]